jgi:hypothetical protein
VTEELVTCGQLENPLSRWYRFPEAGHFGGLNLLLYGTSSADS